MWSVVLTKQAQKDARKLSTAGLKEKAMILLNVLQENPYQTPPPFEKLIGRDHIYSRRINIQHRLVYELISKQKAVKVLRLWTHYDH